MIFLKTLHIFQFKTLYHTDEILVIKRRDFLCISVCKGSKKLQLKRLLCESTYGVSEYGWQKLSKLLHWIKSLKTTEVSFDGSYQFLLVWTALIFRRNSANHFHKTKIDR